METQPLDDNSWEARLYRKLHEHSEKLSEIQEMQKALILTINNLNQRLAQIENLLQDEVDTKRLVK